MNLTNSNSYTVEIGFQDDGKWQDDSNGTLTIFVALLGPKLEGKI